VTWYATGTGIPQHGVQAAGSAIGGVNVLRDSEFLEDGMLTKFEYCASSIGDVTFVVCRIALRYTGWRIKNALPTTCIHH